MNYQRIYEQLINRAKTRDKLIGYKEEHHIIPTSMGGSDVKNNLVYLTGREHFIAHHLLWRIHRNDSMASAWFMMSLISDNQERHKYTSQQYELMKKLNAEVVSRRQKGYKWSQESLDKRTESKRLKRLLDPSYGVASPEDRKQSPECIEKRRKQHAINKQAGLHKDLSKENNVMFGKTHSEEAKKKMSRLGSTQSEETKNKIKEKRKCTYCAAIMNKSTLNRYHNENCKFKT